MSLLPSLCRSGVMRAQTRRWQALWRLMMSWKFVQFVCFCLVVVVEGVELYADILGWVEYNNWRCRGRLLLLFRLEHPILVSPLVAKTKRTPKIEQPTPPNNYHLSTLQLPCWHCHRLFLWQHSRRKTVNQTEQPSSWGKAKSWTPWVFWTSLNKT